MKKIIIIISVLICITNKSYAEIYKLGKLKIELFDSNKLIKTSGSINEGFGIATIKVFAEKTEDNKINSIITTVKYKGDKYGSQMRSWWIDYFFKNKKGIFYENGVSNLNITNENFTNGLVVQEISLKDYLKQQDEFKEFKNTMKKLKKNYDVKLPERVIRSDHVYIKGGDLFWVGHMFNYDNFYNENAFVDQLTKFNPNIIESYPKYKNKMDQWINLSLKRHQEFQDTLRIKKKINLTYANFDIGNDIKFFKDLFYNTDLNVEENLKTVVSNDENKAKEEKAKKIAEQKAKEEKTKKAAEQKAKEEKTKKAAEQKEEDQNNLSVEEIMSKIKELNEMYNSGVISKDEFETLKSRLLKN